MIEKHQVFLVYKYEFSPIFSPPEGLPLHSWVLGKKVALTPTTPSDGPESTAIEVEDIPALLRDVARFAEAVEKLKDVVMTEGTVVTVIFFSGVGGEEGCLQPCTKCESLQRVNFFQNPNKSACVVRAVRPCAADVSEDMWFELIWV